MAIHETLTTTEIKVAETNTVFLGLPLIYLMENAGRSIADVIDQRLNGVEGKKIVVFAGKGGNAGDGFVAARHLASRGAEVDVYLYYPVETIRHKDTLFNLNLIRNLYTVKVKVVKDYCTAQRVEGDVLIDALLGIGFSGQLRNPVKAAVETFNATSAELKVAVDVPTGVNSDTGEAADPSVIADITVTMHYMKPGLLKAKEYAGEIIVAPIGIPREARLYVGPGDVKHRVPSKPADSHKGMGGRVAVIGGSELYTGAPALSALAALRTGSDLAFVYTGRRASTVISSFDPDLIVRSCESDNLDTSCVNTYFDEWTRMTAIILGPGLGVSGETIHAVETLLPKLSAINVPVVIDADALKILAKTGMVLTDKFVLTPHRGEASLLLQKKIGNSLQEWIEGARKLAETYNATILLKAPIDVIAAPDGRYRLNKVHHPAMSVGGTGDVLTGVTGALLSRGLDSFDAAATAAYINGRAGQMAVDRFGERILAKDLVNLIPEVFLEAYTKY